MRWQPYVTKKLCFCELMLMKTSSRVDGAKMITASSWWMPTWRRRLLSPPMPDHQWWTQPLGLLEVSSLVSNNHRLYSPLCCLLCVCCGFCCCINLPHLAAVKTSTDGSDHFVRSSLLPTHNNANYHHRCHHYHHRHSSSYTKLQIVKISQQQQ